MAQQSAMNMTIDRHLADAQRARSSGRADQARRHFEAVLAIDPGHAFAHNALGLEALNADDGERAARHFARATKTDPTAEPLWMNLAKAQRMLKDDAAERAALEQVLSIDQTHPMALIRLAELHERRGEIALATDRWSAFEMLSKSFTQPTPELAAVIAHAKAFLTGQRKQLSDAFEAAFAGQLAAASPRDRRRFQAATDFMFGRRTIFLNECHGYHYPFLPADEYFDREHFPWFAELEAQTATIRDELVALLAADNPGLSPYVAMDPGTPRNTWTDLDHSLDWSALHLWRDGERIDEACARAPRTAALVETLPLARIPGRAPTVFFSILKAGAHIPPHTGVTNTRTIIHLPLVVPGECEFRVGGETRAWREGEAIAFDDTIEHEAWNRSNRDRAVLIMDVWNPYLSETERALIAQSFEVADAQRGGRRGG
jgi:aspartyl/asparaginyl beta-hydroxylase (cupin superfamily)